MDRVRAPIEVPPLPEGTTRIPPVEPEPGWSPEPHTFDEVYILPDDVTLEIRALHGNWNHVAALEVDEAEDDLVRLTLVLADNKPRPGGTYMRTAGGYQVRLRALLSRPLGDRAVVDMARPMAEEVRRAAVDAAVKRRADVGLPATSPPSLLYWTRSPPATPTSGRRDRRRPDPCRGAAGRRGLSADRAHGVVHPLLVRRWTIGARCRVHQDLGRGRGKIRRPGRGESGG